MHVYYIASLNTIFGFVATIYTLITLMSAEGEACAEVQANRGWWLKTEVIAFIALFFLYPGPVLPLFGCTKESHDEILNKGDDESDSEEEDWTAGIDNWWNWISDQGKVEAILISISFASASLLSIKFQSGLYLIDTAYAL